jgi:hypothetical protein
MFHGRFPVISLFFVAEKKNTYFLFYVIVRFLHNVHKINSCRAGLSVCPHNSTLEPLNGLG